MLFVITTALYRTPHQPAIHRRHSYILGIIVYGGRVTDFLDLRCVQSMLNKYLEPTALEESFTFTTDGVYYPPSPAPLPGAASGLFTGWTPSVLLRAEWFRCRKVLPTLQLKRVYTANENRWWWCAW